MKFFYTDTWKFIKTVIEVLLVVAFVWVVVYFTMPAKAEEEEEEPEYAPLYVMTKILNGRMRPNKKSQAICDFELNTLLTPTGRMSHDHMWVEVRSTEGDVVWCSVNYLTERQDVFHVYTLNDKIKIRKCLGKGKVTGYAKKEQVLEITQVVMGYGKCSKGWVDLSYFIEDYE